jgi:tetratricopeptide (TPR) repeat protein/DNA-binding CsgD family transcriptional regulator
LPLIVSLAFLFCQFNELAAQNKEDSLLQVLSTKPMDTTRVSALIDLAYYYAQRDINKTKNYADTAMILSQNLAYEKGIASSYFGFALYHERFGEYDLALKNYLKSLDFYKKSGDKKNQAIVYNTLGISFKQQKNYKKAMEYYRQAIAINKINEQNIDLAAAYINIGNVYADLKNKDSTMYYYQKAQQLYQKGGVEAQYSGIKINLGIQYEENKEFDKAEELYLAALAISKNKQDLSGKMIALTNLGYLFIQKKDYKQAHQYLTDAQELNGKLNSLSWKSTLYEAFIKLESQRNNFKAAHEWNKKLLLVKDSLFNKDREKIVEQLQVRYELEQNKKAILQLTQEKKSERQKRVLLGVVLALVSLLGLITFLWLRSKFQREKEIAQQKEKLMSLEMRELALEQEKTKAALDFRDKELTTFALHLVQKNEFLEYLENDLQKVTVQNSNAKKTLKELLFKVRHNQLIGTDLVDFHNRLSDVNRYFFQNLEKQFPQLTKNEKRLAALLRLGLTTKEVAILNHVGEHAVKMSRHRLRKRLQIDSSINLNEFFQNLEMEKC